MKKLLAVAVLAGVLAGCSPTPYKPGDSYWDNQLGDDTFKISTWVNGFSADTRADNFVLMRSAEIACQNGYRYFQILHQKQGGNDHITTADATIQLLKHKGPYDAKYIFESLFPKYKAVPSCSYNN